MQVFPVATWLPRGLVYSNKRPIHAMATPKYSTKKPTLTHFLCFPLLTTTSIPQLQESLSNFRHTVSRPSRAETPAHEDAEVAGSSTDVVIPEKAFRALGVLHLTLGVMSLRTEEKLKDARDLLESLDLAQLLAESCQGLEDSSGARDAPTVDIREQSRVDTAPPDHGGPAVTVLETIQRAVMPPLLSRPRVPAEPLVVSLQGLQAFPNPRKATVLHCPPQDPTARLYPFSLRLKQRFIDVGLMESENRPLVLHATIVNTVYAKKDRRHETRRTGTISFDATEIMRKYNEEGGFQQGSPSGAFVWAKDILIDRVRICEMGAKAVDDPTLQQEYTVFAEKTI